MLIALPISELTPGMFVDSVTKQHEGLNSIKIKTSGLVRNQAIIKRLVTEGVLELLIDFTKGDAAIPDKYKPKSAPPQKSTTSSSKTKPPAVKPAITLEQEFAKASINFEQHNRKLQALYGDVTTGLSVNLKVIDEMANDIVSSVFRNTSAMTILTRIKDKHSYNWRHMINCAIFTAVFAKYLGYKEEAVQQLAMGALLHDLGQAKLPQGIISRPSKLTSSEMDIIKRHVAQGLGLVKGEKGITPLILDMIVNHHERLDGSGYPRGITAEKLSRPARIMAIVDVYDALTADRPHQEGDEPINALRYLLANKELFDAELVQHFIKCLGVHPVGTIVKLTNERLALVLEGNKSNPIKPKVKLFYNAKHGHHVTPKDLDLNEPDQSIKIVSSIKPLDYQINLARLLKEHLLN
ncbi:MULTISPECIES: HD-GYP domain-containing protein [Pseudoalteromonas]|jgi:HD-GYP domain-containing protein (c-di-GMP phosphodiesterase class II)|uniref:Phosphodiesterase n=1 Tax=Pseudoalteromonas atlantica TaxID=288 RepID=A0ABQ0UI08_PSEAF|nr:MULTISPECIES: HD-GYP domain-containing protein [unclassified Pseudoalteromonas]GEK78091.1 phosphodiesterase [Pseudoalteromonas atlantica]KPV90540.1 Cyclic di-GMP phosphodiesterase response regulator RpfG [Pseudoalteromonas sp. P1-30]MCK8097653.1 HD-GYP domain-containing protein [Pseudoalteromonas sp. 1CM17D]MCK8108395.1 HD-GYP domain-containing protein [Pseudoalteromonas sp. 2CM41L]MCK8119406.1 HD-GYP domain-containing protein [Pseudoalteromonas sp. 2CM37A]